MKSRYEFFHIFRASRLDIRGIGGRLILIKMRFKDKYCTNITGKYTFLYLQMNICWNPNIVLFGRPSFSSGRQ